MKRLYRKLSWSFWLMPAAVGFVYWMWFEPGQPERVFKRLVEGEPLGLYFVFLTALNMVNVLRGWLNVRRLRRRLAGGEPLDHRADYRRAHRRFRLIEGLRWTLVGWLFAMMAAQLIAAASGRILPLPEGETGFPAARLEEVYGGAEVVETVARTGFAEDNPGAYAIISAFNWTQDDCQSVMADIFANDMDEKGAAQKWIDANRDKVDSWIAAGKAGADGENA